MVVSPLFSLWTFTHSDLSGLLISILL